jgi:hypothetical protein
LIPRGNIPCPKEWKNLWKAWDLVTLQMIPEEMLHQKPIDLRHKCLFYIGHIPTYALSFPPCYGCTLTLAFSFLDMLLSKSIGGSPTEPAFFWKIFEVCYSAFSPESIYRVVHFPPSVASTPMLTILLIVM